MDKYKQAIGYFRVVYSEMNDAVHVIHLHRRALNIYRTLIPEDHLEMNQAYYLYQNSHYQVDIHQ
jgi:hypothetical protein